MYTNEIKFFKFNKRTNGKNYINRRQSHQAEYEGTQDTENSIPNLSCIYQWQKCMVPAAIYYHICIKLCNMYITLVNYAYII